MSNNMVVIFDVTAKVTCKQDELQKVLRGTKWTVPWFGKNYPADYEDHDLESYRAASDRLEKLQIYDLDNGLFIFTVCVHLSVLLPIEAIKAKIAKKGPKARKMQVTCGATSIEVDPD